MVGFLLCSLSTVTFCLRIRTDVGTRLGSEESYRRRNAIRRLELCECRAGQAAKSRRFVARRTGSAFSDHIAVCVEIHLKRHRVIACRAHLEIPSKRRGLRLHSSQYIECRFKRRRYRAAQ